MNLLTPDKHIRTLVLRDELGEIWKSKDVFVEVQLLKGDIAREVPGRQTLRFEIDEHAYYRKLHTGIGWKEIVKSLINFRLPITGARNEWLALNRLAEIGVRSFTPVAFGEKYLNPAKKLSFIVTRELSGVQQLDHYLVNEMHQQTLTFRQKCVLMREVACIARTIHANGINHRDLYLCHFLIDVKSIDAWKKNCAKPIIYLADLHRAQIRSQVPRRWLIKDIASICFSSLEIGFTRKDVVRILKFYFDDRLVTVESEQSGLLKAICARTEKLYRREQRLKAQGRRN